MFCFAVVVLFWGDTRAPTFPPVLGPCPRLQASTESRELKEGLLWQNFRAKNSPGVLNRACADLIEQIRFFVSLSFFSGYAERVEPTDVHMAP